MRVGERLVGAITRGLVVLVGVEKGDDDARADALGDRLCGLRIFDDESGKMNRSIHEAGGAMLLVSQFTLAADLDRGRRPSFDRAAPAAEAKRLLERLAEGLRRSGVPIATGEFGAHMAVHLVNDGPATFVIAER